MPGRSIATYGDIFRFKQWSFYVMGSYFTNDFTCSLMVSPLKSRWNESIFKATAAEIYKYSLIDEFTPYISLSLSYSFTYGRQVRSKKSFKLNDYRSSAIL